MIRLENIMVATDFSEPSDTALTYGRELARQFSAGLHVVYVAPNIAATVMADYYAAIPPEVQEQAEESARGRSSSPHRLPLRQSSSTRRTSGSTSS